MWCWDRFSFLLGFSYFLVLDILEVWFFWGGELRIKNILSYSSEGMEF